MKRALLSAAVVYSFRKLNRGGRTFGAICTELHLTLEHIFALNHCLNKMKASRAARVWNRVLCKLGSAGDMLRVSRLHGWALT